MSWFEKSLMARQGVAGGVAGEHSSVTIADQGAFHYVYGPYVEPVIEVAPGGVALEIPATVEIQVDVIKNHAIAWPRLETEDFKMTIGSARPLEDAARIAYRELVRWVAAETDMAEDEAYMLLTMCGKVRLGNMVDPKYTIGASIARRYLE